MIYIIPLLCLRIGSLGMTGAVMVLAWPHITTPFIVGFPRTKPNKPTCCVVGVRSNWPRKSGSSSKRWHCLRRWNEPAIIFIIRSSSDRCFQNLAGCRLASTHSIACFSPAFARSAPDCFSRHSIPRRRLESWILAEMSMTGVTCPSNLVSQS